MMKKALLVFSLSLMMMGTLFTGCSPTKEAAKEQQTTVTKDAATQNSPTPEEQKTTVPEGEKVKVQVSIAASLKNAMTEIQVNYSKLHPEVELAFNADSSGTLQTQIEEGASCDVFFSAAMKQMNALDEKGFVKSDSITKLLENKVVLVKPTGSQTKVTGFENITQAANLALAGEDVPVGAYAREIFTNLEILEDVMAMEINEGANVTAVLAAVSEGSNEIGVVYATDANAVKDRVEIIAEAPEKSLEKPVVYPVGLIKNEEANEAINKAADDLVTYLKTDEAIKVFESYGFSIYKE